jgi:hypothetical protein
MTTNHLFSQLCLTEVHQAIFRNIVSIHPSQDLFDDLSNDPAEWALAQQVEDQVKPPSYQSSTPNIYRPFEDAHWCNAIEWPFKHWQESRFSDGSFGVWYGCDSVETTVYETAYHWLKKFLTDAGFQHEKVVAQRKVYEVQCDAALLDFRPLITSHPELLDKSDYHYAQSVGARLHKEGHPGLLTASARITASTNYAILNAQILSNPKMHCQVRYQLEADHILIEKMPGDRWLTIPKAHF